MNLKKLFPLLLAALFAFLLPLHANASPADEPDEAHMKDLAQSFLRLDEKVLESYGIPSNVSGVLVNQCLSSGIQHKTSIEALSPDDLKGFCQMFLGKLASLKVHSTKIITKDGDKAQVMILLDQIDTANLDPKSKPDSLTKFITKEDQEKLRAAKTKEEGIAIITGILKRFVDEMPTRKTATIIDCRYDETTASYVPAEPKQLLFRLLLTGIGL